MPIHPSGLGEIFRRLICSEIKCFFVNSVFFPEDFDITSQNKLETGMKNTPILMLVSSR